MLEKSGVTLEQLRAAPGGVVLPPLTAGPFYEEYIQTPDRRVDCCPGLFAEARGEAHRDFEEMAGEPAGRLRLITKRDRFMHNSWFHNIHKLKRAERGRNWLFIHPNDAERLHLGDGDLVEVRSTTGAVRLPVRRDPDLMPGVVAATHGWGHAEAGDMRVARELPGVNVNRLLPSGEGSYETLSNMAHMTGIPVEIAKLPSTGT
jgi:anaerobic selenocysteine-containing dehydrogenase